MVKAEAVFLTPKRGTERKENPAIGILVMKLGVEKNLIAAPKKHKTESSILTKRCPK
jgi:hypothetical protein